MPTLVLLIAALSAAAFSAYTLGRRGALAATGGTPRVLHSLPGYHGAYLALWCCGPPLVFTALWSVLAGRWMALLTSAGIAEGSASLTWELGAWAGAALAMSGGYLHARRHAGASHPARDAV